MLETTTSKDELAHGRAEGADTDDQSGRPQVNAKEHRSRTEVIHEEQDSGEEPQDVHVEDGDTEPQSFIMINLPSSWKVPKMNVPKMPNMNVRSSWHRAVKKMTGAGSPVRDIEPPNIQEVPIDPAGELSTSPAGAGGLQVDTGRTNPPPKAPPFLEEEVGEGQEKATPPDVGVGQLPTIPSSATRDESSPPSSPSATGDERSSTRDESVPPSSPSATGDERSSTRDESSSPPPTTLPTKQFPGAGHGEPPEEVSEKRAICREKTHRCCEYVNLQETVDNYLEHEELWDGNGDDKNAIPNVFQTCQGTWPWPLCHYIHSVARVWRFWKDLESGYGNVRWGG